MQKPLVSIVIPIYNAEKYLSACLDSLICQTLQAIEIICVNDGSSDSSVVILDRYAALEPRITLITTINQGAGAARNLGLATATGEYVIFFDSDDLMDREALAQLYSRAKNTNVDIVVGRSEKVVERSEVSVTIKNSIKYRALKGREVFGPREFASNILQIFIGWPWDKLYRRSFLITSNLKFQTLRHSNDTCFVLLSLTRASSISYVDAILFTHRIHSDSLSNTRHREPDCFYRALLALRQGVIDGGNYGLYRRSFVDYCVEFSAWHIFSVNDRAAQSQMIVLFGRLSRECGFGFWVVVGSLFRVMRARLHMLIY